MKESQLLSNIIELCTEHGLFVHHCYDSRLCIGKGFPDLIIAGSTIIYAELKTSHGRLTSDQTRWRYKLVAAGARYEVWTPADLDSGLIEVTLREL